MRMEEIKDKLKQIVIDRLDVDEDQITPDASLSRTWVPLFARYS